MTLNDRSSAAGPPSVAVAAAEADIAVARRNLDSAIAALRRELVLPIAAVAASAALFDDASVRKLREFVRHNALPLGLVGLGAAWLAVENRGAFTEFASGYAQEFVQEARRLGTSAAGAALSAAHDEIGWPTDDPMAGESASALSVGPASGEPHPDQT